LRSEFCCSHSSNSDLDAIFAGSPASVPLVTWYELRADDSASFVGLLLTLIVIGAYGYSVDIQVSLVTAGPAFVVEGIASALHSPRRVLMQIVGSVRWIVGGLPILLLARDASAAVTLAAESLIVRKAVVAASIFTAVIGLLYYDQCARSRLRT
jgi:hypothetical protein